MRVAIAHCAFTTIPHNLQPIKPNPPGGRVNHPGRDFDDAELPLAVPLAHHEYQCQVIVILGESLFVFVCDELALAVLAVTPRFKFWLVQ